MDQTQIDLFYLGEDRVPVGAIVMVFSDHEFSCHVSFSTPDGGHVDGGGTFRMDSSVADWTEFTFVGNGVTAHGSRDETGVRVADGLVEHERTVVPSYAVSALVLDLLLGSDDDTEFLWLDESAASAAAAHPARLVRVGTEDVKSPVAGLIRACERVELTVNDTRTNTYWVKDGVVVATDWSGARSFALPRNTADNVLAALGLTR